MKTSIIIPTRNRADLLADAIESALAQSRPPAQIIVVDNGSSDHTAKVLQRYANRIEAIHEPQPGKSRALNTAMQRSHGDAILVLDDDDILPHDALARHCAALEHNPRADFSFGRYQRFEGTPPVTPQRDWNHPDIERVPTGDRRRTAIKLMEHCFVPNPAWMARRNALHDAGPYDVEALRSLDYDMILRLARANDGAFIEDVVLFQRQHAGTRPGVLATTGAEDVFAAWDIHDRRVFRRIARNWALYDFRPFDDMTAEDVDQRALARICSLQKGVILFAQRCFEEAVEALAAARRLAGNEPPCELEIAIATRMFLRPFVPEPIGTDVTGRHLARALNAMRWPLSLRAAFVQGARWQIRTALMARDVEKANRLLRFLIAAFGPVPTSTGLMKYVPLPWRSDSRGRSALRPAQYAGA